MENANGGEAAENTLDDPTDMEVADPEDTAEPKKKRIVGTFKVSSTIATDKNALPKWFKTAK